MKTKRGGLRERIELTTGLLLFLVKDDIPVSVVRRTLESVNKRILNEFEEVVERVVPKEKKEWKSFSPNTSYRAAGIEGYNQALDDIREKLKKEFK